jgi:hypothetical protein
MDRYVDVPGYMGRYVDVPGYMGGLAGPWEDLVSIVSPITEGAIQEGQQIVNESSGQLIGDLLKSSQFKQALAEIEARAYKGAEDAAKKNAMFLMMFAVAGGAIGGSVLKGAGGMTAAAGIAGFAAYQLMKGGVK